MITYEFSHSFNSISNSGGYKNFGVSQRLTWDDLADPAKGYCSPNHELFVEAEVFAHAPTGTIDSSRQWMK